jgi:hypothetical protein
MATPPQGVSRPRATPLSLVLLVATTCALLCAASDARAQWESIPAASWNEAARPDSGGRDAIVLLSRGEVTDQDEAFTQTVFRRVLVLTARGQDAAKVEVDLFGDAWRIHDIRGRTVRRDGSSVELKPDQVFTTTLWKVGRRAMRRTTFICPGVEPGTIVEYAYVLDGPGYWALPWYLQGADYTLTSEFVWRTSEWATGPGTPRPESAPGWLVQRVPEAQVAVTSVPSRETPREVRFVAHALPGIRDEAMAPPLSDAAARVLVAYGAMRYDQYWSWWKGAFAQLVVTLQKDPGPLTALTDDALRRAGSPEAALRLVHDWLRAHLVPADELAWSEQQGGAVPKVKLDDTPSLADLFERGRGYAFEIDVALLTAAQRLGMQGHLVLVRDRREGGFTPQVRGWPPGDVVVAIRHPDGTWRYHQPASRFARFGSAPWPLRGAMGLRTEGDKLFEAVPCEDSLGARVVDRLHLRLDENGDASGEMTLRREGEAARAMRAWLWSRDPGRWGEELAGLMDLPPGARVTYEPVTLGVSPDSALELRAKVTLTGVATPAGRDLSLSLDRLLPWRMHGRIEVERRTLPIDFRYPRVEVEDVTIDLPAGVALAAAVPPATFENDIGTWSVTVAEAGGRLRIVRQLDVGMGMVASNGVGWVADLLNGLDERDRVPIELRLP